MTGKSRKFIDNFVMIGANSTVKDALDLISKFSPEYVIVHRIKEDESFHYAYKSEFFQTMKNYLRLNKKPNQNVDLMNLADFFDLHEWQSHEVLETKINTEDPVNDPEIKDISINTESNKTTIIFNNNIPVGLLEPNLKTREESMLEPPRSDAVRRGVRGPVRRGVRGPVRRGVRGPVRRTRRIFAKRSPTNNNNTTKVVDKYATGTIPNQVTINEPTKFKIVIKNGKSSTGQLSLVVDKKAKNTSLTVLVKSEPPDFVEFIDGELKVMDVPLNNKNSKPLIFEVNPKKEGWCTITAQFFHKGNKSGEIEVKTKINAVKKPSKPTSSTGEMEMNPKVAAPDLTMTIIEERAPDNGYQYKILAQSPRLQKTYGPILFPRDTKTYLTEIIHDINNYGWKENRNGDTVRRRNITDQMIQDNVERKGETLYCDLFPSDLREFFWRERDEIKSIQIYTKDPFIPWEIIKPWNEKNGIKEKEKFLCEKYALTRWWDGIPIQQKTKIKKIQVIQPKKLNLDFAKKEVRWIKKFGSRVGVKVDQSSTYEEVSTSFKNGGFDLLHISTHGIYDERYPLNSYILLENDVELRADFVVGNATSFGKNNPLIIMNACETGQKGFALSGLQGWANVFLEAKAFGFIGTLWSIGDTTAQEFTKNIYTKLNEKIPLDEAVRQARIEAKQEGDPSWLAYTVYAPSNTPIVLGN